MSTEVLSPQEEFVKVLNDMTASVSAARSVIRTILERYIGTPQCYTGLERLYLHLDMKRTPLLCR